MFSDWKEYSDIIFPKLRQVVDKYTKDVLKQLAKEKIEWISMFASLKLSKLERGE